MAFGAGALTAQLRLAVVVVVVVVLVLVVGITRTGGHTRLEVAAAAGRGAPRFQPDIGEDCLSPRNGEDGRDPDRAGTV